MKRLHPRSGPAVGNAALRIEIVQGQAESLGRAGRKLQASIDRFNRASAAGEAAPDYENRLDEIAECAWALIVQREIIGFRQENLRWVRAHYAIPAAAIARMGRRALDGSTRGR